MAEQNIPPKVERDLNMLSTAWFDLFSGNKKPTRIQLILWTIDFRGRERKLKKPIKSKKE